jgi:hypothetical protein
MKCGSLNEGDGGKQTLDTKIYPVVSVGTRPPLVHVVEALTKSIASWSPNFFRNSSWLATKAWPLRLTPNLSVILMLPSLWSFPRRKGSPHTPHKAFIAAPHQAGGSITCWRATKTPKDRHTEIQAWGSLKNHHKVTPPCSHTLSRASLALHLTKLVLNLRIWSMNSLIGSKNFSTVFIASHELQQHQITRGEVLYRLEIYF